ncbi:hypothetical protein N7444_011566 [Penicillium canescens]|nr:hypothetical protein N7444_011566 [Penicillium canescens]
MADVRYLSPINRQSALGFPWPLGHLDGDQAEDGESLENKADTGLTVSNNIQQQEHVTELPWMVFSIGRSIENITANLLRDGWCVFRQLRLEHWVEHVMGMASATIAVFVSYHDKLSFSLFNFLCHVPSEAEKYQNVPEVGKYIP